MKRTILMLLSMLLLHGCTQTDPTAPPLENPPSADGVYVLNEGGFTKSNASLSFYLPDSNKVYPDVFYAANGRSIGDVANDMVVHDGKAFIVVNNSHKIEVISTETHQSLGTIDVPGNSPNKIVIANPAKGYVTNLYKGTVTSFDPVSMTVLNDSIKVGNNPQSMTVLNGKVYVCNSGYGMDSTVSVIDPATDAVVKTITVGSGPTDIGIDSDGELYVRYTGYMDWSDPGKDTPGGIAVIDPVTDEVKATVPLSLTLFGHPSKMVVTGKGYGFIIVKNGIAKFETTTNTITDPQFSNARAYTAAFDEHSETMYYTDAKDFVQNGMLYVVNKFGTISDSAVVGIIPGTIAIKR